MSKDRLIVSQVAFKGAIDLAVSGKIQVLNIDNTFFTLFLLHASKVLVFMRILSK